VNCGQPRVFLFCPLQDLSALFEEIGPLKNASVASANGVGKGFGFVKL
jgi:hypothetical protein